MSNSVNFIDLIWLLSEHNSLVVVGGWINKFKVLVMTPCNSIYERYPAHHGSILDVHPPPVERQSRYLPSKQHSTQPREGPPPPMYRHAVSQQGCNRRHIYSCTCLSKLKWMHSNSSIVVCRWKARRRVCATQSTIFATSSINSHVLWRFAIHDDYSKIVLFWHT